MLVTPAEITVDLLVRAEAPFEDSFEGALELVAGGRHPASRLESIPDRQEVNGDDVIGDHCPGGAAWAALQTVSRTEVNVRGRQPLQFAVRASHGLILVFIIIILILIIIIIIIIY